MGFSGDRRVGTAVALGVRRLVALVTGWHVAASACYYAVYAGTPYLDATFSLSAAGVGWVIAALTGGYLVGLLPLGAATDRYGERLTLSVGLVALAGGAVLVALAPTYPATLAAAAVLGAAYGTATPGTNRAVVANVAPALRNRALGVKQTGPTVGSALGALAITGLAVGGWRDRYLLVAAVGVAVAVAFYLVYPPATRGEARLPDVRGLLGDRRYRPLVAAGVLVGAGFYTTTGYAVVYLTDSVGAAVATGGLALAALQATGSAGKVAAGWLADALPVGPLRGAGAVLAGQSLVGALCFLAVGAASTPLGAGAALAAVGLFAVGSTGLYYAALAAVAGDEAVGGASAVGQFAATGGGLVAPPAFGYLADAAGYAAGWTALGVCSALAAGLVVVAVRRPA